MSFGVPVSTTTSVISCPVGRRSHWWPANPRDGGPGAGSAALGLGDLVDGPGLAEVLAGRDPVDGRQLRHARGDRAVSGFDLTFCAPKSASVLHMLAPAELGGAVGACHEAAVTDAVAYLERNGLGVRRVRSGEQHYLPSTGAVAAGFVHRTSRALDPHLHTHLVAANVAQGVDGSWSALDSRRLFLHRRATEAVYDSSLRHHLSSAAGVTWSRGPTGGWAVDGVDPVLCRLFSQRAASINEHAHRAGRGASVGARRVAFHADRPDKERGLTVDGLKSGWRRRADMVGLDLGDLVRVVGRDRDRPTTSRVDPLDVEVALARLATDPGPGDRTRSGGGGGRCRTGWPRCRCGGARRLDHWGTATTDRSW